MKLRRIEAARFGALESASLGDLGDGLTVVLGPNEAGKSTFTALVRSVLYGYPKRSESEEGYESASGKRQASLLFADESGEWVVERTEGAHGGNVVVHAASGSERPNLLGELTSGVSRQAYRVVFGFGLGDMAEIASGRGSGDDVLSRLYAAGAGLSVNPGDVRAQLDREAAELFKPSGSKPELNALKSTIAHLRGEIRALEERATAMSRERERLGGLVADQQVARQERDAALTEVTLLENVARRLEEFERAQAEDAARLAEAESELAEVRGQLEQALPDERVLAVAPELDALLEEHSGFRARLDALAVQEGSVAGARHRVASALAQCGLSEEQAARIDVGPDTVAAIEQWREALSRSATQAETAALAAADDEAAVAALDGSADPADSARSYRRRNAWPWYGAALAGVVTAGAGLLLGQWLAVVAGSVALFVAVVGLVRSPRGGEAIAVSDEVRAAEAARTARTAREVATRRATEYEGKRVEWRTWLEQSGFAGAVEHPGAAAQLVVSLKEWGRARAELDESLARLAADEAVCRDYARRLSDAVADLFAFDAADLGAVGGAVARVHLMLHDARATHDRHAGLQERTDALIRTAAHLSDGCARIEQEIVTLRSEIGIQGGSLEAQTLAVAARERHRLADERYTSLGAEIGRLEGELGTVATETRMGELRLELTGAQTRLEDAADRYAVLAVASRLLERTQEQHERTRQPEVVNIAGDVLARITDSRYERIAIPSGGEDIKVFDASSRAKPTGELSRGTAEQLYLALRIALIRQLGQVGAGLPVLMDDILVNFDPARREGAARVIAELASERQVVVFTCHPETLELFDRVASGHTGLRLDRC